MPTVIEIDGVHELEREVFGPVLHVLRYRRDELEGLVDAINATGYGLTFGLHTRIDETIARVVAKARAGNVYVNRNMVGAVVGVQPFGGEGLSGTGPKAGGPLYVYRLLARRPDDVLDRALAAAGAGDRQAAPLAWQSKGPVHALAHWASASGRSRIAEACRHFSTLARAGVSRDLQGPTGERNVYTLLAREAVLCIAERDDDLLVQLAAVLAMGSRAVWPAGREALRAQLPAEARERIALARDWVAASVPIDAILHHGSAEALRRTLARAAARAGPAVAVASMSTGAVAVPLERLVVERSLSINTAAAGGNASLMTIE